MHLRRVFACHATRGRGGEHPSVSWLTAYGLEVRDLSYAPPKNRTKQWPEKAQMERWFPPACGEHTRQRIAMRWGCPPSESSDRAARSDSAAAPAEPRARVLNSRPPSQNGSRRPDRRIWSERRSASCHPPLWKETHHRVQDPGECFEMAERNKQSTEAAVREIRRRKASFPRARNTPTASGPGRFGVSVRVAF